ncbi:sulfurtransferase TusA family protein [Viridibacillus arvi]|uniref:sulfurtransferase TusA family protein n=1 Tax=Viridibacillus arvi TaxID=263475 RepID=UPI0036E0A592
MLKADIQLDTKGLACPRPIVKTKKAMEGLVDGDVLEVQATDKGSKADLAAWAGNIGHQYIGTIEENEILYHYIRKCSKDINVEETFENTISIEEITGRSGVILDVREVVEYAFGHIEGAISIPMGELDARIKELDMDKEIYVICRTGKRSDMAAHKLANAGFNKVYNVLSGMTAWKGELTKNI